MSAVLHLDTVWMASLADPSDARPFPLLSDLKATPQVPARAGDYASGVTRMVRGRGRSTPTSLVLRGCETEDRLWLEDHLGVVLCVRDDRGRKLFGFYRSLDITETQGTLGADALADITVDLTTVTDSDVV